jgi:transcriptional regulator with XRE-family HTH domain
MSGLQSIIDAAGMSRRQLARAAGVNRKSIDNACNGVESGGLSMPSLGAVTRELAAATGRSPGEILEAIVMPIALAPPKPTT